jgi:CRP/FNR family transcriptional regulator, anaerobic regulatory protein
MPCAAIPVSGASLKLMTNRKSYCIDEKWSGRSDCVRCAIRDSVLFSVLNESELGEVLHDIANQWHETGSELFSQGDPAGYIYTLRSGCVKMVHTLEDGSRRIVRMHYRGDAFGLVALLGKPYRNSAIVMQKADICRIPVSVINTLKQHNAQIYEQLIRRWQESLDEAESFITELGTGQAETRLARLLLKLDAHSERHCIPNLLREDIAAIIGVTTETASRLMAEFRRRKFISETDDRGMLCDRAALESLI